MSKILRYKLTCVTENLEKQWLLDDTASAPTMCPTNSAHSIVAESIRIDEVIDNDIKPVRQVLGEDEYTMNPRALYFEAPANSTSQHDKLLDTALAVRGGIFFAKDSNIGDNIQVLIIDKDNVLGMGANLVLSDYVPEWYVFPNVPNELMDVSIGKLPAPGLYLRCIYQNVGNAVVKCALNLVSYKY